ncbi:MAG: hypothetical protein ABRQ26_09465 [Syntrophomonadaceae bacterium]
MDFFYFIKDKYRRLHHHNPVIGWAITVASLVVAFVVILALAPLILEFIAILILIMLVVAALYWVATKTGFIEE